MTDIRCPRRIAALLRPALAGTPCLPELEYPAAQGECEIPFDIFELLRLVQLG
jgi:hypothetical protein